MKATFKETKMETKIGMDQQEFVNKFGKVVWNYDEVEDFLDFELEGVQKLWKELKETNRFVHNVHCVPLQSSFDVIPNDDDELEVFYTNEELFFVVNDDTYFINEFMVDNNKMWDGHSATSAWSGDLIITQNKNWLVDLDNSVILISVSW